MWKPEDYGEIFTDGCEIIDISRMTENVAFIIGNS